MHPATDLDALLKSVSLCLPGLNGNVAPLRSDQLLCGGQGNQERIATLHDYWQQAHPEAGRHYWSTRCWTLLIWQPIYLSLLAAHLEHRVPCLKRMGQSIRQGFVGGFNLPPDCPMRIGDRNLVENAAERLMNLLERQLEEFNSVLARYSRDERNAHAKRKAATQRPRRLAKNLKRSVWKRQVRREKRVRSRHDHCELATRTYRIAYRSTVNSRRERCSNVREHYR